MVDQGLNCKLKNPQYAYIAPTYGQAKKVVWEMLREYTENYPGVEVNISELKMTIQRPWMKDKVTFFLLGAEKYDSHRGIYLDGVILDEFATCDPAIWSKVIRPALSDRKGWAIFISTPCGRNHLFDLFTRAQTLDDWYTAVFPASETGIIDPDELDAAKQSMSESEYAQEFECSFEAALQGAYFNEAMNTAQKSGRITKVPYQTGHNVYTSFDLGVNDQTCIWFFQKVGMAFHFIDYYSNSDKGLEHYVKVLNEKGYTYTRHYLPHDVNAREISTGKERIMTLKNLGLKDLYVVPKTKNRADGINASRIAISRSYFDEINCAGGIDALKNYSRAWDAKEKVYSNVPLHNWASHGADAFRTFATGFRDEFDMFKMRGLQRQAETDYNILEA